VDEEKKTHVTYSKNNQDVNSTLKIIEGGRIQSERLRPRGSDPPGAGSLRYDTSSRDDKGVAGSSIIDTHKYRDMNRCLSVAFPDLSAAKTVGIP